MWCRRSTFLAKKFGRRQTLPANVMPSNPSHVTDFLKSLGDEWGKMCIAPSTYAGGNAIWVNSGDGIRDVYQNEGKCPHRVLITAWTEYCKRKERWSNAALLSNLNGPEWESLRAKTTRKMDNKAEMTKLADEKMHEIGESLQDYIYSQMDHHHTLNLDSLATRFTMECMGVALFGHRMGLLSSERGTSNFDITAYDGLITDWLQATEAALREESEWINGAVTPRLVTFFKAFDQALLKTIDLLAEFPPTEDSIVGDMMANAELTREQIVMTVLSFYTSGLGDTSTSFIWLLHNLALTADEQHKLFKAMEEVSPAPGATPSIEHLDRLWQLEAVMSESFRISPTELTNNRIMPEDCEIGGFHVPKDSCVIMNHASACNEEPFKMLDVFEVDRWKLMSYEKLEVAKIAASNFGMGPRKCPGEALARHILQLGVGSILAHFKIQPSDVYCTPQEQFYLVNFPSPTPSLAFIQREL
eukprot:TRINITY_DN33424_c0_g1_i1.p1 TRINITY_DN33424_c0_g1~~TRINITY_DN33424_c0_g1_i1.p1  ORF type:complete len:473 (+),score=34.60 TRINITY_DN33424_c0_g1_i1:42-1460(+)